MPLAKKGNLIISDDSLFNKSTIIANYTAEDFKANRSAPAHVHTGNIVAGYIWIAVSKLASALNKSVMQFYKTNLHLLHAA